MAFATAGGGAMAHVEQMYCLYDLYFAAALDRADSGRRRSSLSEALVARKAGRGVFA